MHNRVPGAVQLRTANLHVVDHVPTWLTSMNSPEWVLAFAIFVLVVLPAVWSRKEARRAAALATLKTMTGAALKALSLFLRR